MVVICLVEGNLIIILVGALVAVRPTEGDLIVKWRSALTPSKVMYISGFVPCPGQLGPLLSSNKILILICHGLCCQHVWTWLSPANILVPLSNVVAV